MFRARVLSGSPCLTAFKPRTGCSLHTTSSRRHPTSLGLAFSPLQLADGMRQELHVPTQHADRRLLEKRVDAMLDFPLQVL